MRFVFLLSLGSVLCCGQKFSGFDATSLDKSVDPCVNFYQYACGGWMAANPIPGDQSRWGRFNALQERNRTVLQGILEAASSDKPGRSTVEREIGDYYAACMDEKAIDARGIAPLKPDLDRIAAMRDKAAITGAMIDLFRGGTYPFFRFSSSQDAKDSTKMIGDLDQGGLGLPERDYYLKTDAKSVDLRRQYVAHVERMFQLLGDSEAVAAKKAGVVMRIETDLARGSLDNISRRDPNKVYHLLTVKEPSICAATET